MSRKKPDGFTQIGDIGGKLLKDIERRVKGPSAIERRLIDGAVFRIENLSRN